VNSSLLSTSTQHDGAATDGRNPTNGRRLFREYVRKEILPHRKLLQEALPTPDEWRFSSCQNAVHVARLGNERLLNKAAALRHIKDNTDIPVPELYNSYEEDGAVVIEMEYVDGVGMHSLDEVQRQKVTEELECHLDTLHGLRCSILGGPSGIVVPPYRRSGLNLNWIQQVL
jgi:hypothetical protein